jgi:putative ABC transport system substrate-binding protein
MEEILTDPLSGINLKSAFRNLKSAMLMGAMLFALCVPAHAQQAKKVHRIGYLSPASPSSSVSLIKAFREGLAQLGYVEGQNIVIEHRFSEGDRLPELAEDRLKMDIKLAEELIRLKVDIIVAAGGASPVRAAKKATDTIPIVMTNGSDPVAQGFVASLAKPGGNITGLSTLAPEVGGKRLELLKQVVPKLSRVGVVGVSRQQQYDPEMKELEVAAKALGVQLQPVGVHGPNDLVNAFLAMDTGRAGALIGLQTRTIVDLRKQIAERAVKSRLPTVSFERQFVEDGWLMSYGPEFADLYRRAATYVDKILKGAKPADLPIEQPTKFELVMNLKTAKQIGVTIPPNVLARADRVIK